MTKRKKKRIRWSGVAVVAVVLAAICYGIYSLFAWLVALIFPFLQGGDDDATEPIAMMEQVVKPEWLQRDSVMAARLDSVVRRSLHLPDTSRYGLDVFDVTTNSHVYGNHDYDMLVPASCMKLPMAIAAYELLGADYQFHTQLQMRGVMEGDTLLGEVRLTAADDPMVQSLDTLAHCLYRAGVHAVKGRVSVNAYRNDTLSSHPSTKSWDIRFARTPILLRGKQHILEQLRGSLSRAGVMVRNGEVDSGKVNSGEVNNGKVDSGEVDTGGSWTRVAEIATPLKSVLAPMLIFSSNVKAEGLFYHLDLLKGFTPDRRMNWEQQHVMSNYWTMLLGGGSYFMGLDNHKTDGMALLDGSGLSPENRLSAHLLVEILQHAWKNEPLRNFLIDEALPTPGHPQRHGSLRTRMSAERYRNRVFAKTGTMVTTGTSSLSGYIHGVDDHWYIFSIINNNCPVDEGRLFQDEVCSVFMKE